MPDISTSIILQVLKMPGKFFERLLIKACKLLKVDLLSHAHVQIGTGHNTYLSAEDYVINFVIEELIGKPRVIFDVGANVGHYATCIRKKFPECAIYCFEPVKSTFALLKENVHHLSIHCNNIGLSAKESKLDIYQAQHDEDGSMATLYPEGLNSIFTFSGKASIIHNCQFTTLDEFCNEHEIDHIDFLKIDVEGHELNVLKGARDMIAKNRISLLQFEFNEFNIISRSFMKDFYEALNGWEFYRIHPDRKLYAMGEYNSRLEIFRYQNILAINKNQAYAL